MALVSYMQKGGRYWLGIIAALTFEPVSWVGSLDNRFCASAYPSRDFQIHEVLTSTSLPDTLERDQSKRRLRSAERNLADVPQGPLTVSTSRTRAGRLYIPCLSKFALTADTTAFYSREGYVCSTVSMKRIGGCIVMTVELSPCASPPVRFVQSRCRTRPSTVARKLGLRPGHPFRLTPRKWQQCIL